jgi:hypothetical protein
MCVRVLAIAAIGAAAAGVLASGRPQVPRPVHVTVRSLRCTRTHAHAPAACAHVACVRDVVAADGTAGRWHTAYTKSVCKARAHSACTQRADTARAQSRGRHAYKGPRASTGRGQRSQGRHMGGTHAKGVLGAKDGTHARSSTGHRPHAAPPGAVTNGASPPTLPAPSPRPSPLPLSYHSPPRRHHLALPTTTPSPPPPPHPTPCIARASTRRHGPLSPGPARALTAAAAAADAQGDPRHPAGERVPTARPPPRPGPAAP